MKSTHTIKWVHLSSYHRILSKSLKVASTLLKGVFKDVKDKGAIKNCIRGCDLAESSDPRCPTFAPGQQENLSFSIQILH